MTASAEADVRAAALERALGEAGFAARVEADGGLALVVPSHAAAGAALRARLWPLARAAGFTHAAVELVDGTVDELMDGAAPEARAAVRRD